MTNPTNLPSRSDLVAAFTRQRRGLMLTSIVLASYIASGLSLDKLNVLGNTFSIANPAGVHASLWVLWLYFLVRYLQHRHDVADSGPADAFHASLRKRMIRRATQAFEPRFQKNYQGDESFSAVKFWYDKVEAAADQGGDWTATFYGSMTFNKSAMSTGTTLINGFVEKVRPEGRDRLMSQLSVWANTRFFTEYHLPLLVAAGPVVATLAW